MINYFDEDVANQPLNVSAANRKFQQSVIVVQDKGKSGILSFLSAAEAETVQQPQGSSSQSLSPQSQTPSTDSSY